MAQMVLSRTCRFQITSNPGQQNQGQIHRQESKKDNWDQAHEEPIKSMRGKLAGHAGVHSNEMIFVRSPFLILRRDKCGVGNPSELVRTHANPATVSRISHLQYLVEAVRHVTVLTSTVSEIQNRSVALDAVRASSFVKVNIQYKNFRSSCPQALVNNKSMSSPKVQR